MKGNSFGGRNSGGPYGGEWDPSASHLASENPISFTSDTSFNQTLNGRWLQLRRQRRWLRLAALLTASHSGKLHSASHHPHSTVQSEPMKVQYNSFFYPVSIQQASVLSRRGEEVRKAAGYFEAVI